MSHVDFKHRLEAGGDFSRKKVTPMRKGLRLIKENSDSATAGERYGHVESLLSACRMIQGDEPVQVREEALSCSPGLG